MPLIEKQNIAELIGKSRGKYHSALITSYAFDFSFFEQRMLGMLRRSNIRNVNVFIDGYYLDDILENTTGREFGANKNYTLTPVYTRGAFHPKLMLLTGEHHGLLIVGSGNLTGSGISSNDEIWGAFHLSTEQCQHPELFLSAWTYFTQLRIRTTGFTSRPYEWIKEFSPWLNKLQTKTTQWSSFRAGEEIILLFNSPEKSILEHCRANIKERDATGLLVISPFYDSGGQLVMELGKIFDPLLIKCVVDPIYGTTPIHLDGAQKLIRFHKWQDVVEKPSRLHAKIFQFSFGGNITYTLLGSANATTAAFGTSNSPALNDEACILIRSSNKTNYIEELGISFSGDGISVNDLEHPIPVTFPPKQKLNTRISYAELSGTQLTIFLLMKTDLADTLVVLDDQDNELNTFDWSKGNDQCVFNLSTTTGIFKVFIANKKQRISNFQLIHHVDRLLRNNPDPEKANLDEQIEKFISGDDENILALLELLTSDWGEEPNAANSSSTSNKNATTPETSADQPNYQKLSEQEFNIIQQTALLKQEKMISAAGMRIADLMSGLSSKLDLHDDDVDESEESRQLMTGSKGDGESIKQTKRIRFDAEANRSAFHRFLKNLNKSYKKALKCFYDSKGVAKPNVPVSSNSLSNIIIAIELAYQYYGKKYTVSISEEDIVSIAEYYYLEEGSMEYDGNMLWFLNEILGRFLLLATAGFIQYEYQALDHKQERMRTRLFYMCIHSILNISWNESIAGYRDTLLLNVLHIIPGKNKESIVTPENLAIELPKIKNAAYTQHPAYGRNLDHLMNKILPAYRTWNVAYQNVQGKQQLIKSLIEINKGQTIFKKFTGFCKLKHVRKEKDFYSLQLSTPGFEWCDENCDYILKDHPSADKTILFESY